MTTPTITPPSHLHSLNHITMDNFHSSSILPSASAPTSDSSSGALISDFRATPLQTRVMEYQPGSSPTATPIQRAFNEFERAVALLVMRSTDLDRAEMILRAAFNQLVNELRAPYSKVLRSMAQNLISVQGQNSDIKTPYVQVLESIMERNAHSIFNLKEKHQIEISSYQTNLIRYIRKISAHQQKYQAETTSYQQNQLSLAQKISGLHEELQVTLGSHQTSLLGYSRTIATLTENHAPVLPTHYFTPFGSVGGLPDFHTYQDGMLLHQRSLLANAHAISANEEMVQLEIAFQQANLLRNALAIATLEEKHQADITAYRTEIGSRNRCLHKSICRHSEELEHLKLQLLYEISSMCSKLADEEGEKQVLLAFLSQLGAKGGFSWMSLEG